jgi:phage terminase large subunit-like protein
MQKGNSLAKSIALLPERERQKAINSLSHKEAEALIYDWEFWARSKQLPPDWDWYIWLLLSGRGGGKTRTGAELVLKWAREGFSPIALVGQTKADVRDTMVEVGDSAILNICPPWFMPEYESSKRRLTFPNGVLAIIYSGDEPDQLRGPQHSKAWVDELSKFKYPQDTWDNLMFGLRIGDKPQVVVTTTPRPIKTIKALVEDNRTAVTRGHTLENRDNLAPDFLRYILSRYEGTRLGRQELAGEVLDDNPDALWERGRIDELRVREHPDLIRVVVGVDPAVTSKEQSADTGIIVAGIAQHSGQMHGYILDDLTIKGTPDQWANAAVTGYYRARADRIIGEVNNGGDMVGYTVQTVDPKVPFKSVHASRGKYTRAEPVSALYEQGRIHHVGFFPDLEDQLCEWVPGDKSPDRLDALVWAITELMLEEAEPQEAIIIYDAMETVRDMELV